MTYSECEIVADAGQRLLAVEESLARAAAVHGIGPAQSDYLNTVSRAVANARGLLASLPLEATE